MNDVYDGQVFLPKELMTRCDAIYELIIKPADEKLAWEYLENRKKKGEMKIQAAFKCINSLWCNGERAAKEEKCDQEEKNYKQNRKPRSVDDQTSDSLCSVESLMKLSQENFADKKTEHQVTNVNVNAD